MPLKRAPFPWGDLVPHVIDSDLAHPSSNPKRHLIFLHSWRQTVAILYNRPSTFPPIPWGSEPPPNTWFLGPTRVLNPTGILISWTVFAQLTTASLYSTTGRPFSPQNCHLQWGIWTPSTTIPWAHTNPNGISIDSADLHSSLQSVPILYNGRTFSAQNCTFPWGIWTLI